MKKITKRKEDEKIGNYLAKGRSSSQNDYLSSNQKSKSKKKKIAAFLLLLLFIAVIIFSYFSFYKGFDSFDDSKVSIMYAISNDIASGEENSVSISCNNGNNVEIDNVRLEISLPDNFIITSSEQATGESRKIIYWDMDKISAKSTEKVRIFGKFMGQVGEKITISGKLTYTPQNFNSNFQTENSADVYISSLPIKLTMDDKSSVANQTEEEFVFKYQNDSDRTFGKIEISLDAGTAFTLISSSLKVSKTENNIVYFEDTDFAAGQEKELTIKGIFNSNQDEEIIKVFLDALEENGTMIKYAEIDKELKIKKSDILIMQTINGEKEITANKGEELNYVVNFKNQSGEGLKNLVLEIYLNGNFDDSSIEAQDGTVNGNKIIWNADKIDKLASLENNEEGNVNFKVKVKDYFDIESDEDKNFTLESDASLSVEKYKNGSNTIKNALASDSLKTKINAFLYVEAKGFFNDDGRIENKGELPPEVGEETSYTVHLIARNFFNDTKNIRIAAKLADNVDFTGKYIDSNNKLLFQDPETSKEETSDNNVENSDKETTDNDENEDGTKENNGDNNKNNDSNDKITEEKIYYNTQTRELIWEIPEMKANDSVINSAKEIIFQIEAKPQKNDIGKTMELIDGVDTQAFDEFTGQDLDWQTDGINTLLEDDYSIGEEEAKVAASK